MKTINRLCKATVVIAILGIGLLHNMNNKSFISNSLSKVEMKIQNEILTNDSLQVNENRLLKYSKSVLESSIQRLISNL